MKANNIINAIKIMNSKMEMIIIAIITMKIIVSNKIMIKVRIIKVRNYRITKINKIKKENQLTN
jgi:hypothetical protein